MAQDVQKTNHVVYRSNNGHVVDIHYVREKGWVYADFVEKVGAPTAIGSPAAFVYKANNSQNIFYRGHNGHLHVLNFVRGRGWKTTNLNQVTGGMPAGGDASCYNYHVFNSQHVIYRSRNNHLYQLYADQTDEWKIANMTEKTGAPLATGNPTSYAYESNNSQNLIYRGQDGHIHKIYFIRGEGWKHLSLTELTGGPLGLGDPSSYTYHVFNSQHVVYIGQNNHLYQLYAGQTDEWKIANMTEKTGAPLATGNPSTFIDPFNNSQNLIYRGQDGHIHDIYFIRGGGWKHLILTQLAGTPPSAGSPFGYTFDLFKSQHVVYRAQNGHLYQLYSGKVGDWKHSDLTGDTGAPISASDPSCYTYDLR